MLIEVSNYYQINNTNPDLFSYGKICINTNEIVMIYKEVAPDDRGLPETYRTYYVVCLKNGMEIYIKKKDYGRLGVERDENN